MKAKVIDSDVELFENMLYDIKNAKHYIYLESFRFNADGTGRRFRDELIKKVKEGVNVKLLLDAWGSNTTENFFKNFKKAGGELRFFQKIHFNIKFIGHNHKRDHRKLLIIDDDISYIGSANITDDGLNWLEFNVRIKGNISLIFRKVFLDNYELYNKHLFSPRKHQMLLKWEDSTIIRDVPSFRYQKIKKRYLSLIKSAKKEIILETPYFMPGRKLRRAFKKAVKRGVSVNIIIPLKSDVKFMDFIRGRNLGWLHRNGVKIHFYSPKISHGKGLLIDKKIVIVSSSNLDYRSFVHQYEIALESTNKELVKKSIKHFNHALKNSVPFNYKEWRKRHIIKKVFERLLSPFRHFF